MMSVVIVGKRDAGGGEKKMEREKGDKDSRRSC